MSTSISIQFRPRELQVKLMKKVLLFAVIMAIAYIGFELFINKATDTQVSAGMSQETKNIILFLGVAILIGLLINFITFRKSAQLQITTIDKQGVTINDDGRLQTYGWGQIESAYCQQDFNDGRVKVSQSQKRDRTWYNIVLKPSTPGMGVKQRITFYVRPGDYQNVVACIQQFTKWINY